MSKVAVIGSRPPRGRLTPEKLNEHHDRMQRVRDYVTSLPDGTVLVTCDTDGVCREAFATAKRRGLPVEVHYPDLEKGSKAQAANYRRLLESAERAVVYWDGAPLSGTELAITIGTSIGRERDYEMLVLP